MPPTPEDCPRICNGLSASRQNGSGRSKYRFKLIHWMRIVTFRKMVHLLFRQRVRRRFGMTLFRLCLQLRSAGRQIVRQ